MRHVEKFSEHEIAQPILRIRLVQKAERPPDARAQPDTSRAGAILSEVDEFTAVSRARETYTLFAEAMQTGRDILLRAGIAEAPPPVPEFDTVFRRLPQEMKRELFAELEQVPSPATRVDALRIWQPLIKRAFAGNSRR